jgi:hypothetical protein
VLIEVDRWLTTTNFGALHRDLFAPIVLPAHASMLVLGAWPNLPGATNPLITAEDAVDASHVEGAGKNVTKSRARVRRAFESVFAQYPQQAHFISLFDFWCEQPLPVLSDADDVAVDDLSMGCSATIPGTAIAAYPPADAHLNTVGSIYMWPHVCDAMEAAGLFTTGSTADLASGLTTTSA